MKSKKNILFTLIIFAITLLCFDAYTHVQYKDSVCNIENSADSSNGKEKCPSSCESYDDYKISSFSDCSFLEGAEYNIPLSCAPVSSYIISFWQPPKIS
jgi:hypothetical protein